MSRERENKGGRRVGLGAPAILVPAVVSMALVALLLLAGLASGRSTVVRPSQTRTFDAFTQSVRDSEVQRVQMYRDTLYVTPREGPTYLVQDVSPDFTIGLLFKYQVPLEGIPQPRTPGPILGAGVLIAILLPYLLLGWLTVMMVRAANGAAKVDPEAIENTARCPECSRSVARDARFCQHCAHPLLVTGQVRHCAGCNEQVWRSDRHCRSCGRALPVAPLETRRLRAENAVNPDPSGPLAEAVVAPEAPALLRRERSHRPTRRPDSGRNS
ncbi:MAG: zinc ribbon domain-containing protein [Candidatus Xenobium sp.]|nr:zinc ribbon domain-containing protein [Burkholderiales bacterium]